MKDLRERLTEILTYNLAKNYTAASYAIMIDGEIVAADAVGTDGSEEGHPVTVDHTFNVCSISKIFCTTAVMKLVEQGKVNLDTPVCHYLPRFTMLDERYKDITVRHLLNHSSGLPGTQWKHFSATRVSSKDNHEYYDEVYEYLAKSHLKADPGEYSVYCNDGFTLAEMVVAAASGIPFGEFCKKYITDPIGAKSTRTSTTVEANELLVREKTKVPEYFYLQGCGGFTTNMIDLCKFGNLFLCKNDIISEESKAEMAKPWGRSFLEEDTATTCYGLGWDNVHVNEPEFDLGEHVLRKGGNSFQFTSDLYVIPKYNAVLTISETHDCKIDVAMVGLSLLAVALQEKKGISIYRKYQVVPEEIIERYGGTWLTPSQIMSTHFFGTNLTIMVDTMAEKHLAYKKDLKYNGKRFVDQNSEEYFFAEHGEDKYILSTRHGRNCPEIMKAKNFAPLSDAWKARVGKSYIAISHTERDMVSHELMLAFTGFALPGYEGVFVCSFKGKEGAPFLEEFESCVIPVNDHEARGFINTPYHGSRDLTDPYFEMIDGIEHCFVGSNMYRDASSLPLYAGETFESEADGEYNRAYRFEYPPAALPEVPKGKRLMVLNDEMVLVYDSQTDKGPASVKGAKKGYLIFVEQ